jgi:hypothetical protein
MVLTDFFPSQMWTKPSPEDRTVDALFNPQPAIEQADSLPTPPYYCNKRGRTKFFLFQQFCTCLYWDVGMQADERR